MLPTPINSYGVRRGEDDPPWKHKAVTGDHEFSSRNEFMTPPWHIRPRHWLVIFSELMGFIANIMLDFLGPYGVLLFAFLSPYGVLPPLLFVAFLGPCPCSMIRKPHEIDAEFVCLPSQPFAQ